MVAVPEETPDTTPENVLTVATADPPDVQVPPLVPLLENVVVSPGHIFCVPDKSPAFGAAVTVTVRVADEAAQPLPAENEYVITEVPALIPVTTPEEFTVATDAVPEDHVPFKLPLVAIVVLPFEHSA
jgi:hypothetical protein